MRACVAAALAVFALAQDQPRPNVLLVTVDALRADRVTPSLAPTITALAARGARAERAYTHAPLTLPAHASLLTGLLPPSHGVRNNGFRLDDGVTTLGEVLGDAGYATGAFVGASALDARFGLAQGFAEYDDRYDLLQGPASSSAFRQGARPASAVVAAALAWVTRQREPWFAWAHLRDPHAPYVSYDQNVTAADAALGTCLAALAAQGVLDRTVVVVTGDHGESLGEHGEQTHGVFAYEAVLRVPLVIAGPGVPRRVMPGAAAHVDVVPTIVELIGATGAASDGRSLLPALRGEAAPEIPIYFEALDAALMRGGAALTGVVEGRWKFIDLPAPELYDLAADPAEAVNRVSTETAIATRLRDLTVRARAVPQADLRGSSMEPEARARLRSLGYVGSASWRLGAWRLEDDPKRLLPLHRAYEAALDTAAGDPGAAVRQLRLIIEQRPDFAAAVDATGALLAAQGKTAEAIALLTDARAGGLRHRVLAERLAATLLAARDARTAAGVLEPVIEADQAAVDARFLLARAYNALGNPRAAAEQLKEVLRMDPTFTAASDLLDRLPKR